MRDHEHTPSRMRTCSQTHTLTNAKRMQIYSEKPTDHSTSPLHKHDQLLSCQANDIRGKKTSDRLSDHLSFHDWAHSAEHFIWLNVFHWNPSVSSELEIRESGNYSWVLAALIYCRCSLSHQLRSLFRPWIIHSNMKRPYDWHDKPITLCLILCFSFFFLFFFLQLI